MRTVLLGFLAAIALLALAGCGGEAEVAQPGTQPVASPTAVGTELAEKAEVTQSATQPVASPTVAATELPEQTEVAQPATPLAALPTAVETEPAEQAEVTQPATQPVALPTAVETELPEQADVAQSEMLRVTSPAVSEADLAELVAGNSAFAFDLYQAVRANPGNLLYSPYSISLALAMTYAGAEGETKQQMADTFSFTLPDDRLNPAFNALDLELARRGEASPSSGDFRFQLNIANAIWGQKGYPFLAEFLDVLAQNYGAGLRLLDFASAPEESRLAINDWVGEQTEGKIPDLMPQGVIDDLTRLVLTNAIYFNAAWAFPFEPQDTEDGPFHLLDGGEVSVPMMKQSKEFGYAEGAGYQAVSLPYGVSGVSMVLLVPQAGQFEAFESSLNAERVDAIVKALERWSVTLSMPKFDFESSFDLGETLEMMGMPDAFSATADFSGMTGSRELFISAVVHKAFISVDEEGTEAAAATAVGMPASAAGHADLTVDRPFVFLIRDYETGAILFAGRVVNPAA
ncbi:MAG: serpin family protein [Dehalococcoidia bacterium]|nr:serpin family protein [Dehalococcoidia bacterium]